MEFNQVLELVRVVSGSELTTFQYEEGNQKILMQAGNVVMAPEIVENKPAVIEKTAVKETLSVESSAEGTLTEGASQDFEAAQGGTLVKSPLVGRFYAAPSEDAEPFIKVGDTVKKGQVLAIVEAMKLMNEIESEYDGVVAEILVENGQGVEYGQPLFRLK